MTSIVVVPTIAVCTGAVAALAVPFIALQEILDKRMRKNFKKHLKRRSSCRVNFGEIMSLYGFAKCDKKDNECATSVSSNTSNPPAYEDIVIPPPPYNQRQF
ncbi:unnamed protein product [Auanema sp. JU1783]|nr:unnamed protein product [Auanema sp. JU1783]